MGQRPPHRAADDDVSLVAPSQLPGTGLGPEKGPTSGDVQEREPAPMRLQKLLGPPGGSLELPGCAGGHTTTGDDQNTPGDSLRREAPGQAPGLGLGVSNSQKSCLVFLHPPAVFLVHEYGDEPLRSPGTPSLLLKRREVLKQSILLLLSFRETKRNRWSYPHSQSHRLALSYPLCDTWTSGPAVVTLPGGPHGLGSGPLPIPETSLKIYLSCSCWCWCLCPGTPVPPNPMPAEMSPS